MKKNQVKITENIIYSTFTSSTKEEEDFRVLLIDKYTLHASNILKLSFISSVSYYLIPRVSSGGFYFASGTLQIAYGILAEMPYNRAPKYL
jgi:hypothetical protein